MHTDAPAAEAVPDGQFVHAVPPAVYLFAGQVAHEPFPYELLFPEKPVPAGQFVQGVVAFTAYCPLLQIEQDDAPPVDGCVCPLGQLEQVVAPVAVFV